ncbi:hypothetical protein AmDm5_2010 [Acetobacter malorum]|nr:hypothetical protein AmDm5_2010 [Acetobacter malorum]
MHRLIPAHSGQTVPDITVIQARPHLHCAGYMDSLCSALGEIHRQSTE